MGKWAELFLAIRHQHHEPVGDIKQDREYCAPAIGGHLPRRQGEQVHRIHPEKQEKRGQEPQGTARVEVRESNAILLRPLLEEQACNEKPAQYEEEVDADVRPGGPGQLPVCGDNQCDRESSQAVEGRLVAQPEVRRNQRAQEAEPITRW